MLSKEELEKLYKAGEVVYRALEKAMDIVRPGARILDICTELENYIISQGAKPAFPVNIGINHVAAHYTARIDDDLTIPEKAIVKVDIGAHIDGYIVDAAITLCFNPVYEPLVQAALEALKVVKDVLRAGLSLGKIGSYIERAIRGRGFKPIENLTGHLIRRYELHAGKSVPNVDNGDERRVLEGEIYAIEPFATDGRGSVRDTQQVTIYRLIATPKKALKRHRELILKIQEVSQGLPFSPRWLVNKVSLNKSELTRVLEELSRENILYAYPVLVEEGGGMVSQFEDTFIVKSDRCEELAHTLELFKR